MFAIIVSINANSQEKKKNNIFKKVFKYATPYVSYSQSNSLQASQTFYVTQQSELIETTVRNPENFAFNFGLRKLARFGYEEKVNFYDGNESKNVTQNSNVGSVDGSRIFI